MALAEEMAALGMVIRYGMLQCSNSALMTGKIGEEATLITQPRYARQARENQFHNAIKNWRVKKLPILFNR